MRTIGNDVSTEIVKGHTRPCHIAEIGFDSQVYSYLSEGPSIDFNGNRYIGGTLEIRDISFSEKGFEKASMSLLDYGSSVISVALNNRIAGSPCTVYLAYQKDDGAITTPVELFSGFLEPDGIFDDRVQVELLQKGAKTRFFPNEFVDVDNGFNHSPKSGTVIVWGDEKIELVN